MSSEEPFNYIEHKIKEAAENQQIVFEESSWEKMEALLGKQSKRKSFEWLWFFVPLAIAFGLEASVLWLNKQPKEKTYAASLSGMTEKKLVNPLTVQPAKDNKIFTDTYDNLKDKLNDIQNKTSKIVSETKATIGFKNTTINIENHFYPDGIFKENKGLNSTERNNSSLEHEADLYIDEPLKRDSLKSIVKNDTAKKNTDDSSRAVSRNKLKTKKKTSAVSRLYLLGTIGAEFSSTKFLTFKNSPVSARYGFGIGYKINKRVSLQTGFYASKKKYIANEGDYNFKTGSYYTMVKVTKVDADCIVYEIPVSVRYNVLQKKSFNIYTVAGLSSYIMKKEEYNVYFIKNNREMSYPWKYTGNKDFVSTLNLSAGAEKKITDKFSLQIEPIVSIPLKGVGEGKVKIFSTALQVGLKYFPFKK